MNNTKKSAVAARIAAAASIVAAASSGNAAAQAVPPSYIANPDIYKVIAQDDRYIVLEVTWKPGQKDKMHSHPKGLSVHFLTDCHSRTTTADGKVAETRRKAGETVIAAPIAAHTFENLGTTDCRHLHVEAKQDGLVAEPVQVSGADLQAWLAKGVAIAGEDHTNGSVFMVVGEASQRTLFYRGQAGDTGTSKGTQRVVGDTLCTKWAFMEAERCREWYRVGENNYEGRDKGSRTKATTLYLLK